MLPLLPALLLLVSYTSKEETCAMHAARQLTTEEAAEYLGVELKSDDAQWQFKRVQDHCEFYKNQTQRYST